MTVYQQLILLAIPVAFIWPLTAVLVRLHRRMQHTVSPQSSCFQAGAIVFFVDLCFMFVFLRATNDTGPIELLGSVAFLGAYCGCCFFLNWFIFTVTETSMHTHLIVEIGRDDGLTLDELRRRYNKQKIIAARVPRLVELGQLTVREGRLALGGNWVLVGATMCYYLRILLSIPPRPVQDDGTSASSGGL